ncbi:MAG TPA: FAD binding domain-containing protein [Anaerolineales bacterium]|nr:FAD binding domain-containing protein [Anaerolineales bacterium]
MITAYHRPKTLDEALTLLAQPNRTPLGGGTLLSKPGTEPIEAVDLQSLSLDAIKKSGNNLEIGATVTLQQLLESEHCPEPMKSALKLEAPLNLRNAATVAGTVVTCDGRSTFGSLLLALDAKLEQSKLDHSRIESRTSNLGDFLPLRDLQGSLVTSITIPLNVKLAFEYVSRTPADKPIVCAALAQWNSGRTRLVLGGYGKSPLLAMDGTEAEGVEAAARNAFHEATDEWATAEYRLDIAATLAKRCLEMIA